MYTLIIWISIDYTRPLLSATVDSLTAPFVTLTARHEPLAPSSPPITYASRVMRVSCLCNLLILESNQ